MNQMRRRLGAHRRRSRSGDTGTARLVNISAIGALAVMVFTVACAPAASAPGEPSPSPTSSVSPSATTTATASATPSGVAGTSSTAPASPPATPLSSTALAQTKVILDRLVDKSSDSDPRYYRDKVWYDGSPQCFRCTLGPAVLAAVYGTQTHDAAMTKMSIDSFDLALRKHQHRDGSINPPGPGEDGPGIQTVFFANKLAQTYLILEPELDRAHRVAWAAALTKSADYLIRSGNLRYYINGNINLGLTMNMDLTYKITGLTRFRSARDRSLAFTLKPPKGKWSGYGLKYVKKPTARDGSDGAAYLAESGGKKPGFDPAYTMLQADVASLWYYLTGNEDAHRLTNLLYNQLFPLVRTSDWTIDVSGGTRRTAAGVRYRFYISALSVLALKGGRSSLDDLVAPQLKSALIEFGSAATYVNAGQSENFGLQLAMSVLVVTKTPGW